MNGNCHLVAVTCIIAAIIEGVCEMRISLRSARNKERIPQYEPDLQSGLLELNSS